MKPGFSSVLEKFSCSKTNFAKSLNTTSLLLYNIYTHQQGNYLMDEPKKQCPHCGKIPPADGKFCVQCDSYLGGADAQKQPGVEKAQEPMKICQTCGSIIKKSAILCPVCKKMADRPIPTESVPPANTKSNGFAIAGFVLSFLVPLLGLIFGAIGKGKAKDSTGRDWQPPPSPSLSLLCSSTLSSIHTYFLTTAP